MAENAKKIKYLVVDTAAFINAVPLNEYGENILTTPDVITEVRNKRQLRRLCVLPFDLQVREPRDESVKHCIKFAKKTGDYASLSGIDVKVIALTYELEADNVGTEHLRTEPIVAQVIASGDKPEEMEDTTKLAGWYVPTGNTFCNTTTHVNHDEANIETARKDGNKKMDLVRDTTQLQLLAMRKTEIAKVSENTVEEVIEKRLEELFEKLKFAPTIESFNQTCEVLMPKAKEEPKQDAISEDNNYDEDGGWITPANIQKVKGTLEGDIENDLIPQVACMSTDYALQNVLKQMNLNISALNGRVIKNLRTYILRCYACFKTTSIMTKVFCPNCGNKTLKRVAVSLDENGKQVIHINTKRPLSKKYKNQSLPRFHGGKHSRNPILFEDQPIPRQMPTRVAKTKTNPFNDDYTIAFSPFVMRDIDSKSAMLRSKGHLKEWARNNNFEEDRRRKNYNRVYK